MNPASSPSAQTSTAAYQPAIEVTVDPEKVSGKPSKKLQLEDAQVTAGINTDQTFVSNTILIFGDNMGDRRLIFIFQSLSTFTNFTFSYLDISKRLQKGITVFDDRTYFLAIDQSTGQEVRDRRAYRTTGGLFSFIYPLSRYHRVSTDTGFISRSIDYPYVVSNADGTQGFFVTPRDDNFPIIQGSFIGDTTLYQEWGPLSGRRYRAEHLLGAGLEEGADQSRHGRARPTPPR